MQRLERLARSQLGRLYTETRRAAGAREQRAVDRVHELIAFTRGGNGDATQPSRRPRMSAVRQADRHDE
jgi:hypothetical protein